MMRAGFDESFITEAAEQPGDPKDPNPKPVFPSAVAKRYVSEVRGDLKKDFDASVLTYRAEQMARLHRDLGELRTADKKNWSAIRQHEQLAADVMGTRRLKIDITADANLNVGMAAVIAGLSVAEFDQMVDEQAELERTAEERRAEFKALPGGKRSG